MFRDAYRNQNVLITGHTGFKGSWLSLWLSQLGARVFGYALPPSTTPNHFSLLNDCCYSTFGDICDPQGVDSAMENARPSIVFHLAAQSLVSTSYQNAYETFEKNILGTARVIEACRASPYVRAIVIVTSDKCYENDGRCGPYSEEDRLGGSDPYSASKGCAEIVTACYRRSIFQGKGDSAHVPLLASARAGNVIGGGDWSPTRIVPDVVRAVVGGVPLGLRNAGAVRPWQHVLDCLGGYLLLGERLLSGDQAYARGWNFGPDWNDTVSVLQLVEGLVNAWGSSIEIQSSSSTFPEAERLNLDCNAVRTILKWKPLWTLDESIKRTVEWYKSFYDNQKVISIAQLNEYTRMLSESI
ncbi:MAG: CDP-glucose 4,6-dehydratase [Deltaproteobacteria bacterium]|nr:CDP-glucose 4,6-dehydratase [Deltaproteobacteria bacterium]